MTTQKRLTLILTLAAASVAVAQPPGGGPGGGGGGGSLGDGIWRRNAGYGEALTFDSCTGHQTSAGNYHYHGTPKCLRLELGDNIQIDRVGRTGPVYSEKSSGWTHSPILAWTTDGYPMYGPYGYSDPKDATSAIKRLKSGFRLRSITTRTTLPDWALGNHSGVSQTLTSSQYGPAVSTKFPLGRYVEDFEWASGVGDLDQYNGRFTITPEFPNGTYAYYATIDDNGDPAFPYLIAGQFYGTVSGTFTGSASTSAVDYFNAGTTTAGPTAPAITSWVTKNWNQYVQIISGFDPSVGPLTTSPGSTKLSGATAYGGLTTATYGETQRVRYTDTNVYVNSNGLPATMGPWFEGDTNAGVFTNFPSSSSVLFTLPRSTSVASSKSSTGMDSQGLFVNGVPLFNFLDGNSYSNSSGDDGATTTGSGGPIFVSTFATIASSASYEQGPQAPGSLVTATPLFYSALATSTESATSTVWPTTLGGATVSVKDSAGSTFNCTLSYASPTQLNFLLPSGLATGAATATITAGGVTITSKLNVQPVYPSLFLLNRSALAAATLTRVHNGTTTTEQVYTTSDGSIVANPIALNGDQVYLTLYGSGLGTATSATATIGGVSATVAYSGPQGTYSGLDQYNILIPTSLAGKGKVDIVVTSRG